MCIMIFWLTLLMMNRFWSEKSPLKIKGVAILRKGSVIFSIFVMVTFFAHPIFSQTGRSYSTSRNTITSSQPKSNTYPSEDLTQDNRVMRMTSNHEQPVRKTYEIVPDPQSNTTLRIVPGREDAGYWASVTEYGKSSETVMLYFSNASSMLDLTYSDNAMMLSILDRTFSDRSMLERMDYVTITGASSPDGYSDRNEQLASERALAIKNYIVRKHPHVNRDRILTFSAGEDWDGLRRLIEADYNTPYRNEALKILNLTLSGEAKRKQLRQLASGKTYKYLSANMFPHMRGGAACMIYFKQDARRETVAANGYERAATPEYRTAVTTEYERMTTTDYERMTTTDYERAYSASPKRESRSSQTTAYDERPYQVQERNVGSSQTAARNDRNSQVAVRDDRNSQVAVRDDRSHSDMVRSNKNLPQYQEKKTAQQQVSSRYADDREYEHTVLAVKTNLLFDAVTALNVELEVPAGDSWSVSGEYIFPWWLNEKKQNSFQLISGNLELRRWLGYREESNRLTGWFGGLFVGGGYFDWERDKKGYQGEFYLMTGLSGGYAHEISKDGRWRMEYSLGLGYMTAKYREYNARTGMDNEWHLIRQKSGNFSFAGPLKAKISLVWTLKRR